MTKLFSVASWNVEHFGARAGDTTAHVQRVVEFIGGSHAGEGGPPTIPDVFAIFEVTGRDVYRAFMDAFPDHNFVLSEGKQSQEIFVAVHKRLQMFGTQRLEFKGKRDYIRPGVLLTVRLDGQDYSLLFLHLKSGEDPDDFGLRDQAISQAFSLKRALDRIVGGPANFIVAGDLTPWGSMTRLPTVTSST